MKVTHDFLMPDYFTNFSCKMGACRSACCVGWPISVSMQNYFRLLGIDCPKPLRDRLDVGLRMVDNPTNDRYAQFSPRYDGNCPLRLEDGRCAIHAELGEEVLPDICRLYPRGIRTVNDFECSCANSCEGVVELLFNEKEPIRFVRKTLTVDVPENKVHSSMFDTLGRGQEIRLCFIRVLQDRRYSLAKRLLNLYRIIEEIYTAMKNKDSAAIDETILRVNSGKADFRQELPIGEEKFLHGFDVIKNVVSWIDERHDSVKDFADTAIAYYCEGEDISAKYNEASTHFEKTFPHWENWFENLLVNHMFFSRFPLQERPVSFEDEYIALCSEYAILRFVGVGWMADKTELSDLVDVCAAAFRIIDHTEFEPYAAMLLRKFGVHSRETLENLLVL